VSGGDAANAARIGPRAVNRTNSKIGMSRFPALSPIVSPTPHLKSSADGQAEKLIWEPQMDFVSLIVFAGALIVAAGSPGPSVATLVARVIARGHRDVLPFLAAMWIGEAIWLSLAVWGLNTIAESFHLMFLAIKWMGIAYLLFLAWKMWTAPTHLEQDGIPERVSPAKMFATGLAVTLGNPKIMVFYMALLPAIIDLRHLSLLGWAELTGTMVLVLVAVDLAWVLMAVRVRRLLRSPRAIKLANRWGAGMMAGAATAMATR
jgi:threonine/homoserine/homoserine lactone efflux protein